jgi:hypothetical protein
VFPEENDDRGNLGLWVILLARIPKNSIDHITRKKYYVVVSRRISFPQKPPSALLINLRPSAAKGRHHRRHRSTNDGLSAPATWHRNDDDNGRWFHPHRCGSFVGAGSLGGAAMATAKTHTLTPLMGMTEAQNRRNHGGVDNHCDDDDDDDDDEKKDVTVAVFYRSALIPGGRGCRRPPPEAAIDGGIAFTTAGRERRERLLDRPGHNHRKITPPFPLPDLSPDPAAAAVRFPPPVAGM